MFLGSFSLATEVMAPFVYAQLRTWLSVKTGRCVPLTSGDSRKVTRLEFWGDTRKLRVLFLDLSPLSHAGGQEVIWGGSPLAEQRQPEMRMLRLVDLKSAQSHPTSTHIPGQTCPISLPFLGDWIDTCLCSSTCPKSSPTPP